MIGARISIIRTKLLEMCVLHHTMADNRSRGDRRCRSDSRGPRLPIEQKSIEGKSQGEQDLGLATYHATS